MRNYENIEGYIREAHLRRSQYLAELLSEAILATGNAFKRAAEALLSVARARTRNNVFTFDA